MQRSATCIGAATLLVGLILAPVARAYDVPAKLNEVALHYSLGVGEIRCASPAEWDADGYSRSYWAYSNVRKDYAVFAPLICDGALDVANTELPAWQRAVGTLVLVHEAFHLRHWRFRRDEGKVECQAMVYFTDAAQKLGASEAESNNLYPYALAWHRRQVELLPWYGDPKCVLPPWIPPSYLVETFLARGRAGEREARERRARAVADQLTRAGTSVRFGGTIHIPEDEICFVVFDAASGRTAALAATRAELDAFRIVEGSHVQKGERMNAHRIRGTSLLVGVAALFAAIAPTGARADAVTDWNAIASNAIVTIAGQPPAASALSFAIVQGAVYDAVNAIDGGYQTYLVRPAANPWDSKEAAAAAAAYKTLAALFQGQFGTLQPTYEAYIAALPDTPAGSKAAGVAIGESAAAAMLAARANDGRGGPPGTLVGTTPGVWRPTIPFFAQDPTPWLGDVLPFLLPNAEMVRSDGPNALSSAAYAQDFNEVKQLGSNTSTKRTADQTEAAIWWQTSGAFWNAVTRALSAERGLDIAENARLFAMEDLAAADGFIGCYKDKYYWKFWRPVTAIREADTDGNPATEADADWTPLFDPSTPQFGPPLSTPPFPDHPSAHSCATSAIVHTMQQFFGTDKIAFSAFSPRTRTTRSFDRLSYALKEVIDARVWGGIHFRTADVQGTVLGNKVAQYLKKHYFQQVG